MQDNKNNDKKSQEGQNGDMRIEDWVKAESKAKLMKKLAENKKIIIGAAAGVCVLIIVLLIILIPKGSKNVAKNIACLEGLDVMCGPNGITPDGNGGFLVTDIYGKKIWRAQGDSAAVFAGASTQKNTSGQPLGGYKDGTAEESLFQDPWAITPFLGGFAVSDTENHAVRLIRNGNVETINGHSGFLEMDDMGVVFEQPTGLSTDDAGNLYVADTAKGTIYVISTQGAVEILCTNLNRPMGICWHDNWLFVAETGEHRIVKVGKDKPLEVIAGTGDEGDDDGEVQDATFSSPQGVCVGPDGTVYVCDTVNAAVRKIKSGKVSTILKMDDSQLVTYPLSPAGACFADGKLYVCDPFSRRVYVLKP